MKPRKRQRRKPVTIVDRIALVLLTNGPVCNRVICQQLPDINKQSIAPIVRWGIQQGIFLHHDFAVDAATGRCTRRIALNTSNSVLPEAAS